MNERVVEVRVSEWEYGCCLPPPVIGDESSWHLTFVPDLEPASEHLWTVVHDGPRTSPLVRLDGGSGLLARWYSESVPPPAPGIHTLRGGLYATAHAGAGLEDPYEVTGRIRRIRVVSEEMRRERGRHGDHLAPVPGSMELTDVGEGPELFASTTGPGRAETGLVLDLQLPQRA